MKSFNTVLMASLLALPAVALAQAGPVVTFSQSLGGVLADPGQVAPYVYVSTGTTVNAYDYSAPKQPVLTGTTGLTPLRGWITGLTRKGNFLYAGWTSYEGAGGIAVYLIKDRAHPKLIGQLEDYTDATSRAVQGLVAAHDHLYLFDGNNGIFVGDLTNPRHPVFTLTPIQYYNFLFQDPTVQAGRIYMTGRDFIDDSTLQIYGTKSPTAPTLLGSVSLDGFANFRVKIAPPYAIGFGYSVTVTDISNPKQIVARGSIDSPMASNGFVNGTYAYGVGGKGVDIWSFANPDAPVAVGHSNIDGFDTLQAVTFGTGGLLLTGIDSILDVDTSNAAKPKLLSNAAIPGGVAAKDLAIVGDKALILQEAYGFSVNDATTLATLGRVDLGLPQQNDRRDFEAMTVDGTLAYTVAWGTGLIIEDISNPLQPSKVGQLAYFGASAIDEAGGFAYVGKKTNGGEFMVVDATNPAKPVRRSRIAMSAVSRIKVNGTIAFVADEDSDGSGGGGLRIIDVSKPAAAVQVGFYNANGCTSAHDLVLDAANSLVYVACTNGTHIVDVSNVTDPVKRGLYHVSSLVLAQIGSHVFVGTNSGFDEVDVTDPAKPVRVKRYKLAFPPLALRASADGRLFALDSEAGLFVYAAAAGDAR
jgi:hypothetical protein